MPRLVQLAAEPSWAGFSDLHAAAVLGLGGELASLIDFDGPLDLFVTEKDNQGAFAARARQPDGTRFDPAKLTTKLVSVSPGRWEIHPADEGELFRCELWHAAPPVGYRVVCGKEAEDVTRFAPLLLGHFAKHASSADVRLELSKGALLELNSESSLEALLPAESMAVNLKLLEQDVELGVELDYLADGTSPLREAWLGAAQKRALPAQFWQIIDVSRLSFVSAGADEKTAQAFTHARTNPVQRFFERLNLDAGIPRELSERMAEKLGDVFPEGYRFSVSMGGSHLPALIETTTATRSSGAWTLLGYAGSGDRYRAALDVLFAGSKRFVRLNKRFQDLPQESIVFRADAPSGKGSFVWVLPGPDWIWSLSADSEASLLAQARSLLPHLRTAANPDEEQTSAFAGEPPLLAGSITLSAVREMFPESMRDVDLPFGGATRVLFRVLGERRPAQPHDTLALSIWSRWSPAAIADLVVAIKAYQRRTTTTAP